LTSELGLAAEQATTPETAFFALTRSADIEGSTVERGDQLAELQDNAILKALADLHQREESAFLGGAS
jgi:hypothetical protein